MIINLGDAPFKGFIKVTYPNGTCTVSLGDKSFSHSGGGTHTFTVNKKGTWTVKATNAPAVATRNVEISSRNQTVSISLTPRYYLFESGSGSPYTINRDVEEAASFAVDYNSIRLAATTWGNSSQMFYFNGKINLTNFTKLCIDYNYSSQSASNNTPKIGPSADPPPSRYKCDFAASFALLQTSSRRTDTLNISGCNGSYYTSYIGGSTITFYNIWLE